MSLRDVALRAALALLPTLPASAFAQDPSAVPSPAAQASVAVPAAAPSPAPQHLAEADAAWARRAEGAKGSTAAAGPMDDAIAACRKAISAEPEGLEARWRLMRALYFRGEHVATDAESKKKTFDDGRKEGEAALAMIRRRVGAAAKKDLSSASPVELVPYVKGDAAALASFLWAGVDWGKWALVFGKMAAVKQGAAAKIRDYATAVIRLDPKFEDGGGYRVLGRLHHQTPAVPFFTGWASRDEALRNLRLAVETAPRNAINRLYLADATFDYDKPKRAEARRAVDDLIAMTPSDSFPLEDLRTQEDARALKATWAGR